MFSRSLKHCKQQTDMKECYSSISEVRCFAANLLIFSASPKSNWFRKVWSEFVTIKILM